MKVHTGNPARHRGLTLTEILVAVTIFVILSGIAIPLAQGAIARSRQAACLKNLSGIGVALESYLQDHNQMMPVLQAGRPSKSADVPVLENTLTPYLPGDEAFHCPADSQQFAKSGSSYLWNSTQSGRSRLNLNFFGFEANPTRIPLVSDKEAWHPGGNGANILYADYSASREIRFAASGK